MTSGVILGRAELMMDSPEFEFSIFPRIPGADSPQTTGSYNDSKIETNLSRCGKDLTWFCNFMNLYIFCQSLLFLSSVSSHFKVFVDANPT